MRHLIAGLAAIAGLVGAGLPALSEPSPLRALASVEDGKAWDAVGRLDIAGTGFCTGALIADDLVLTAAHCLFDPETGTRLRDEDIEFRAGWRNGRASAYRTIKLSVPHPGYVFSNRADTDRVRHDLALLQLVHPIRSGQVAPFSTDSYPQPGAAVGVVSYAHNRSEVPAIQDMCHVMARQDGVVVLSCDADFGSSGAPVFSLDGGLRRIVSVVSAKAKANGRPVSLGSVLDGPLQELMRELSAQSRFHSATRRHDTGAKFVRP